MKVPNFPYLLHTAHLPKYQPAYTSSSCPTVSILQASESTGRHEEGPGPLSAGAFGVQSIGWRYTSATLEKAYCLVGSVSRAKISNKKEDLYKSSFLYK